MPDPDPETQPLTPSERDERQPEKEKEKSPPEEDSPPREILRRLSEFSRPGQRYELQGEIARGGMGAILRVWDRSMRRHLAMKVVLQREDDRRSGALPVDSRSLSRFLEEGQVTGQLDHPGIVPVHEIGLDGEGRIFFTMKLVKGEDLRSILEKRKEGREGWTKTRVLGILLRVCEAMAYAHSKGVIHRDLKPGNVMVGRFGEVYVMDWGLARVLDQKERHDVRIAPPETSGELCSERQELAAALPDSPLRTMDGDVVGTPAYMPPEQALGRLEEIGAHSDVYAVGAILYHLLAGHMPYVEPERRLSNHAVLLRVQQGPPVSLDERAPGAPPELVAICEKAMARDWSARYRNMGELADDLRAFLERRVVPAYETGALAELRKWTRRNRGQARALAAGILALVAGLTASLILKAHADRNAVLARESQTIAEQRRVLAEQKEEEARARGDEVLRLSAFKRLEDLLAEADELWPANPEHLARYEDWLERAGALIAGLDPSADGSDRGHRARLAELRARARPPPELEIILAGKRNARFGSEEEAWWHDQLEELVAGIEALADPDQGLIDGISPRHGWGIRRRHRWASEVVERTVAGAEARRRWEEAIASIADAEACPLYGGLRITPQLGLLPLGRDGDSGLWEFAHVQSGEEPGRDAHGKPVMTEAAGLVLVLLPGGTFTMGAQAGDPAGPSYDPHAHPDEGPPHPVTLAPFFLSKYELTQGQWLRSTGANPSFCSPGELKSEHSRSGRGGDLLHPVERVSWDECAEVCSRMDLSLPSEAQWEYAARSGRTGTPDQAELAGRANLADQWARTHGGPPAWAYEAWDDGNAAHAAVGSYEPDAFGLHDMLGNLWEWCQDGYDADAYARAPAGGDPVATTFRLTRGGGFNDPAFRARVSLRNPDTPGRADANLGLRPARALAGAR